MVDEYVSVLEDLPPGTHVSLTKIWRMGWAGSSQGKDAQRSFWEEKSNDSP